MASASKNIFWLSVSRLTALALLFFAYTQLFRYLGPYSSGQYQFVLSYVTIFGVIIDFGLQQYIIKRISEEPNNAKKYFHNFLAVEVVIALLVYGALAAIAWLNNFDAPVFYAIIVAGAGNCLNGLTYPFLSVMSAFYDLKRVAFLNFIGSVVNVIMIFVVIFTKHGIVLLAAQQVIFAVIQLAVYSRYIKRHISRPEVFSAVKKLDYKLVKTIFIAAFPFALLVGFSTIYNRIDAVLITKLLGYTQTGYYTAAYKLFDLLGFFPAIVSHSLYPVFATMMAKQDISAVQLTLERYFRFMLALALPIGVGGTILAKPIIILLAGEQFAPAAPVLAVLAWAPATLFVYIVANALVISQLTRFAVGITGTNVVINILGNIILLPRIGILGAAIMTVVSEALQGLFYFTFIRRKITTFRIAPYFWQPLFASIAMGYAVWHVRDMFLGISILIGAAVYIGVLFGLRFFRREDWQFVKNFIRPQTA